MIHEGQYKDLVGQLAFNVPIDTLKVAAVGFRDGSPLDNFAYIVHENFHQYQFGAFGEIHWEREERYPLEDRQNTALAYLEMRLLMAALDAAEADRKEDCRNYISQFVATRYRRWQDADPLVRGYEQGEEINEGTAKYVEIKSIALLKELASESPPGIPAGALLDEFDSISMPDYLLEVFRTRLAGNSISPADMSRYRIYPVGCAEGFLLDYLGIDWKSEAEKAGTEFTFAGLFKDHLGIDESQFDALLAEAKRTYDYDGVLADTGSLIEKYEGNFLKELSAFESQPGPRVEIELSTQGESVSRSRSSSADKWVVDNGTRELRRHYNVYVLKTGNLLLQLRDMGALEEYDWDAEQRRVTFYPGEIESVVLDGDTVEITDGSSTQFGDLEMLGPGTKVHYSGPGTITSSGRELKVNLIPGSD
jgi:hypothetical protein